MNKTKMVRQGGENLTVREFLKLLALGGLVLSSAALPGLVIAYNKLPLYWKKYRNRDIGIVARRSHQQELSSFAEKNNTVTLVLSEKGQTKKLRYNFDELTLEKKRDGELRVVIFDIPNRYKTARDLFRRKLKELGFAEVQESVFITPYKCKREIELMAFHLGIAPYVIMFQIGEVELGPEFEFIPTSYKSTLER